MSKKDSVVPPPSCPDEISNDRYPSKFVPEDLPVGQAVWYKDERYYVEATPRAWADSCYIRIGDQRFNPEKPKWWEELGSARNTFCVHADLLELAPVTKNRFGRQPTKTAVERRAKMREEGIRDNGDEVAVMLRACKTLDHVYSKAAAYLGKKESELRDKYKHLDNGRQRMCLGNVMRGEAKRRAK